MALLKSGKSMGTVTRMDAERKKRSAAVSGKKTRQPQHKQSASTSSKSASESDATGDSRAVSKRRVTDSKAKRSARKVASPRVGREQPPTKQASTSADTVRKKSHRRSIGNRRFNTEKVERIKAEIAQGEYQINYLQIADKFIEHERHS